MLPRLFFIAFILALTVASLTPGQDLPAITFNDKAAHFAAYFLLALNACALALPTRKLRSLLLGIVLYGIVIEACQGLLIPGRHASLLDALANTFGVIAAIAVYRYRKTRSLSL